ncbi:arrestin domain-containing protein 3-like [Ylistrum balloti]|uniref:arrestin domain-containing protein 3-like n=1 Tax=Ylistrum balloti TaxID=509963 RepID=UPI00290581F1|nr:arrestin domain-containing protein 3-like [Ylistrum balloti]
MVVNLLIKIENNERVVYFPGQTVQACVQLFLTEGTHVKGIYAKFKGIACTSWTEGTGDTRKSHRETEQYFKTEIPLVQAVDGDYVDTQPGDYKYPVDYVLPSLLPSSFEGRHGSVRYMIKAKMKTRGGNVYRVQYPFTVIYKLDLNAISGARMPTQMQDTKTGCCLCCKTGPVSCMMCLDKQGYVCGENINISAEITNNGSSLIRKTTVQLLMNTTFKAYGSSTHDRKVISTVSHGTIGPGESDIWNGDVLPVLSTPPSYLYGCSLIDIQYSCELVADMDGSLLNIVFDLPIIIGTIPLCPLEHQPQPPVLLRQHPTDRDWALTNEQAGNISLDNITIAEPITSQIVHQPAAPPSYEECMTTDRVRIMRQNSNSTDQEDQFTNFTPSYPYYKQN